MCSCLMVFPAPCPWTWLDRQVVANDGSTEVRRVLAVGLSAFAEEDAGRLIVEWWKSPGRAHVDRHQY